MYHALRQKNASGKTKDNWYSRCHGGRGEMGLRRLQTIAPRCHSQLLSLCSQRRDTHPEQRHSFSRSCIKSAPRSSSGIKTVGPGPTLGYSVTCSSCWREAVSVSLAPYLSQWIDAPSYYHCRPIRNNPDGNRLTFI